MKKIFPTFVFFAVVIGNIIAQEFSVNSGSLGGSFLSGNPFLRSGNYIYNIGGAENSLGQGVGVVQKLNVSGITHWSSFLEPTPLVSAAFGTLRLMPNGDIVGVGNQMAKPLITRLSSDGNIIWSKTFQGPESLEAFTSVDYDSFGNLYAYGTSGCQNISNCLNNNWDILVKFDPDGNVIWSKKVHNYSQIITTRIFVKGNAVLAFGQRSYNGSWDLSMTKYSLDGDFLDCKLYGHFNHEMIIETKLFQDGVVILYRNSSNSSFILRLDANMNPIGQPKFLYGGSNIVFCTSMSVDADNVYVFGFVTGTSIDAPVAMKLNSGLQMQWCKKTRDGYGWLVGTDPYNGKVLIKDVNFPNTVFFEIGDDGNAMPGLLNCSVLLDEDVTTLDSWIPTPASVWLDVQDMSLTETSGYVLTSFDPGIVICPSIILPITLYSFTGERVGRTSHLKWTTVSERNNSHFKVMRSSDEMESWKHVGTVDGAGDSFSNIDYQFVDDEPKSGLNYYKLVQVDNDGASEEFHVVVIEFTSTGGDVMVYPNPSASGEPINVKGEFQSVMAFDHLGRNVSVQRNGNQLLLPSGAGMYSLTFFSADGGAETVRAVIN